MFQYKVSYIWGLADTEFESKYHVAMMKVTEIRQGRFVKFEDVNISIDLARVQEMTINGQRYELNVDTW